MRRPGDLPREELIEHAKKAIRDMEDFAEVHFKFTCENCGERCILVEPNTLYEKGECHKCGHETEIKEGGYMLQMSFNPPAKETDERQRNP